MSIKKNKHRSVGMRELYAQTRAEVAKMSMVGWVCATSAGYLLGDGNVNDGLKQHMVTFGNPSGFDFMVLRTRRAAADVCREWNATLKGTPTIFRDECHAFPVRIHFGLEVLNG